MDRHGSTTTVAAPDREVTDTPGGRRNDVAAPAGPAREAALEHALEVLRERRDEFAAQGHVPRDFVDLLKVAGIYRVSTPESFGGELTAPGDFLRTLERIAEVDPATAWVASFGSALTYFASLPIESQQQVYADGPDVVFAGGMFPMQEARRVDGGFELTGTWQFASGCAGADWLGVGLLGGEEAQGRPVTAIFPASDGTIVPNWDVAGMRATGSNAIELKDFFVPEEFTFVRGGAPRIDEPVVRYPVVAYAAQVLAVTALGAARAAVDLVRDSAVKASITGGPKKAAKPSYQAELARAEARLRSARSWFYEITDEVWQLALTGDDIDRALTAQLRLATTHVAHESRAVILEAFDLAGTGAIYRKHPMQRFLQDGLVPAQHAMLQSATYEAAGAVLVGADVTIPSFP